MQRKGPLTALFSILFAGCVSPPQVATPPEKNPRIAERNLTPASVSRPITANSRVIESPKELQLPDTEVKSRVSSNLAANSSKWILKTSHRSVKELFEDWGASVDYEVIWEAREFPLDVKKDKLISTGDFWHALTTIGESYRHSDAPFQVLPTTFKQIVILPMNQTSESQARTDK